MTPTGPGSRPRRRATGTRIVALSAVGIVALGIHVLLGLQTAAFATRLPDDASSRAALSVFQVIATIAWFVFLGLIAWAWVRLSPLLIAIPIVAFAFLFILISVADQVAPSSLPLYLI